MKNLTGKIAFASGKTGDYDIWIMDVQTGEMQQATFGTNWNDKPAWSPDGKWLAYVSNQTGYQEIFKVSVDEQGCGDPVQLTVQNKWCDSPRFSPCGTKIAFVSNVTGNNDIWIMDADGSNGAQVTTHDGEDTHVEWTRDGKGILWASNRDQGDADIWHMDLETQEKRQLTNEIGADNEPVQHMRHGLIAFVSNRAINPLPGQKFSDRDRDVWLMREDGTYPVKLTTNQGCDFCICWSPDGNHLVYASNEDKSASHLRVLDVSDVVEAYATGDPDKILAAAKSLRSQEVKMDREPLKAEIGAYRKTTFVTQWMPEKWVESCYPKGFFGQERYPHWVDPAAQVDLGQLSEKATHLA